MWGWGDYSGERGRSGVVTEEGGMSDMEEGKRGGKKRGAILKRNRRGGKKKGKGEEKTERRIEETKGERRERVKEKERKKWGKER